MLYDVGGDVLVGDPVLFTGEEVELYRQTFRGGVQLADEDAQVGVDLGQGAAALNSPRLTVVPSRARSPAHSSEAMRSSSSGVQKRIELTSMFRERATRRPWLSRMPLQFLKESLTRTYGGTVVTVLSQLRTLTVFSVTSSTVPLTPYLSMTIQSPGRSMS